MNQNLVRYLHIDNRKGKHSCLRKISETSVAVLKDNYHLPLEFGNFRKVIDNKTELDIVANEGQSRFYIIFGG